MQIIPPKLFNRIKMNLMGVPIPPFVASSFAEVDECYYLDFWALIFDGLRDYFSP